MNPTLLISQRIRSSILCIIPILIIGLTSCKTIKSVSEGINNNMEDAIRSMDYAIDMLATESSNWQVVISNLESEIAEDMQSTIQHEISNLTKSAISSAGAEVRCNASYMKTKVRRELIDIRNSYASRLNASLRNLQIPLIVQEPVRPFICDIVPSAVDMSLDRERRTRLDIYGYDLRSAPIKASYKTYGNYQSRTPNSDSNFFDIMGTRLRETTIVRVMDTVRNAHMVRLVEDPTLESVLANNHGAYFRLLQPYRLFDNDISHAVSVISDFHAVLDLSGSGANLPPNAKEVLLSWDSQIQSEIPVITYEKVLECNTYDTTVVVKSISFIPQAVTSSEYGGNPDFDFAGHGPCIEFNMRLYLDPSRKIVYASMFMDVWECPDDFSKVRKDYTQAIEAERFTIFRLIDPDMIIVDFNMDTELSERYIDFNENSEIREYGSYSPASQIVFTGDTSGDEAGTETGATVTFNPLKLRVQKCTYK